MSQSSQYTLREAYTSETVGEKNFLSREFIAASLFVDRKRGNYVLPHVHTSLVGTTAPVCSYLDAHYQFSSPRCALSSSLVGTKRLVPTRLLIEQEFPLENSDWFLDANGP